MVVLEVGLVLAYLLSTSSPSSNRCYFPRLVAALTPSVVGSFVQLAGEPDGTKPRKYAGMWAMCAPHYAFLMKYDCRIDPVYCASLNSFESWPVKVESMSYLATTRPRVRLILVLKGLTVCTRVTVLVE